MTEGELHIDVVGWLRLALPVNAVFHHSPNEGKRGWKAQKALKSHGVKKGWPDLEIVYRGQIIFIELKAARGRVSSIQRACHRQLTEAGALVCVCRSVGEVQGFLEQVMPLKVMAA